MNQIRTRQYRIGSSVIPRSWTRSGLYTTTTTTTATNKQQPSSSSPLLLSALCNQFSTISLSRNNNSSPVQSSSSTLIQGNGVNIRSLGINHRTIYTGSFHDRITNSSSVFPDSVQQQQRTFASNKKVNKKKTHANKKKLAGSKSKAAEVASLQHVEWVNFQRSITVDGFETGQTTQIQSTKKARGGKATRKTKLSAVEIKIAERQRLTEGGGGQYPPVRYSDEETERLLNQAYEAIPKRTGKRGTRNLKRQNRRWELVRTIHKKYKNHLIEHHYKRMAKRSIKVQQVKAILQQAPDLQSIDRSYQAEIFKRWYATVNNSSSVDDDNEDEETTVVTTDN